MFWLFHFLRMLLVAPWVTRGNGADPCNFKAVDEGIFRSGQPGRKEFESLARRGFKSIINLRNHHSDLKLIRDLPLKEFRLGVNTGSMTKKNLLEALQVVCTAPRPLLIHCWHGSDRTGAVVAAYRVAVQHWDLDRALAEMHQTGYHEKVYGNLPDLLKRIEWTTFRKDLEIIK